MNAEDAIILMSQKLYEDDYGVDLDIIMKDIEDRAKRGAGCSSPLNISKDNLKKLEELGFEMYESSATGGYRVWWTKL